MVIIKNSQRRIDLNLSRIKKDTSRALNLLSLKRAELGISFVGDRRMSSLNKLFRGIDKTTDVLSFPIYNSQKEFPKKGSFLIGDIVIDPNRALSQSKAYGLSLHEETIRLIIHGLLHLMGYDHERSLYMERIMRKKEAELLYALTGKE